jgi:hypothetical protein
MGTNAAITMEDIKGIDIKGIVKGAVAKVLAEHSAKARIAEAARQAVADGLDKSGAANVAAHGAARGALLDQYAFDQRATAEAVAKTAPDPVAQILGDPYGMAAWAQLGERLREGPVDQTSVTYR